MDPKGMSSSYQSGMRLVYADTNLKTTLSNYIMSSTFSDEARLMSRTQISRMKIPLLHRIHASVTKSSRSISVHPENASGSDVFHVWH